jgi:hypothetical protein
MKMNILVPETNETGESTVIWFGDAELILRENGHHELVGGSGSDQIAAREYISFFLHDVVVNSPSCGTALGLSRMELESAAG